MQQLINLDGSLFKFNKNPLKKGGFFHFNNIKFANS